MEKKALGKGLEALLPTTTAAKPSETLDIHVLPIDSIVPNRYQPRYIFAPGELAELAASIGVTNVGPALHFKSLPWSERKWMKVQTEDGSTTNSKGVAPLTFNPYCEDGKWCEGTYKYRLLVNGNYTVFTIRYEP